MESSDPGYRGIVAGRSGFSSFQARLGGLPAPGSQTLALGPAKLPKHLSGDVHHTMVINMVYFTVTVVAICVATVGLIATTNIIMHLKHEMALHFIFIK